MTMSFETALNIAAEVVANVPDNTFARNKFLGSLNWERYWEALGVLVDSGREMPGPLVIFLPGECGVPISDRRFDRIKNRSEQLCDCGNVRLLPGATMKVPNRCPIFIRRRNRQNSGIALLRLSVEGGVVQLTVRPFDPIHSKKYSVSVRRLMELDACMIGIDPPDAAMLTILDFDGNRHLTEIEVNGQYEVYEPPFDPEQAREPSPIN
jgi:hypothetical protein